MFRHGYPSVTLTCLHYYEFRLYMDHRPGHQKEQYSNGLYILLILVT